MCYTSILTQENKQIVDSYYFDAFATLQMKLKVASSKPIEGDTFSLNTMELIADTHH